MLMTGFLSLNVHDSLTFDGTELCLHPDLFPISSSSANASANSSANASTKSTNSHNHGGLAVGDMIEIRVWDPLPQSAIVSSASSSSSTASTAAGTGGSSCTPANAPVSGLNRKSPETRQNIGGGGVGSLAPAGNQNLRSTSNDAPPSTGANKHASQSATTAVAESSAPTIPNESFAPNNVSSKTQTTNLRPRALSMTNSLAYSVDSENPQSGNQTVENTSIHSVSTAGASKADDNTTNKSTGEETAESASLSAQDNALITPPSSYVASNKSPNPPVVSVGIPLHQQSPKSAKIVTLPSASAATAVAASLPPVFPRTRLNSASTEPIPPVLAGNLLKPKSISFNRRGRSAATISNTLTAASSKAPPNNTGASFLSRSFNPSKTTPLHSRDISDVTVDTQQLDNSDFSQAVPGGVYSAPSDRINLIPPEDLESRKLTSTHMLRLSFVLLVTDQTLTTLKGNTRTQVSMLRQVADLYSLSRYDTVTVHKIAKEDEEEALKVVSADYVVMSIKDQFISRGDMMYFQNSLKGSWIYEGERLIERSKGIKAHAREIRHGNASAKSGIVTDKTMITFRSRSARIFWLVQLSSEMWEYSSPYDHTANQAPTCEIYFDKWIRFLHKLFTKWKEIKVR